MCGGGGLLRTLAPILGGIGGSLLIPGIGTALGADLGAAGGIAGSALGAGAGEAVAGGNLRQDLTAGLTAGAGTGILDALGGVGGISDSLGLGGGADTAGGLPVGQVQTISAAPVGGGAGAAGASGGLDLSSLENFNSDLASATGGAAAPASVASQFASGAATAPGASGGILNTLKQALAGAGVSPTQALSIGGIGLDALKGNQKTGAEKSLAGNAAQENTIAGNIQNGTLNPAQQASVTQQTNDAINAIKSKYASMGLSGSTLEQQAIQQVRDQSALVGQQVAQQAATGALSALGASDSIYQQLMASALGGDESLMRALAALGASGTSAGTRAS